MRRIRQILFAVICCCLFLLVGSTQNEVDAVSSDDIGYWLEEEYNGVKWHYQVYSLTDKSTGAWQVYTESEYSGKLPYILNSYPVKSYGGNDMAKPVVSVLSEGAISVPAYETCELNPYAFYGCENITKISVSGNITNIGLAAFSGCKSLEEFIVPRLITNISQECFFNCESLWHVKIPSNCEKISSYAFSGCKSLLGDIKLPETVTEIGEEAFLGCCELCEIDLPGVKRIESGAFKGCKRLWFDKLPDNIEVIQKQAFYDTNIMSVDLPESVKEIGSEAFFHHRYYPLYVYAGPNSKAMKYARRQISEGKCTEKEYAFLAFKICYVPNEKPYPELENNIANYTYYDYFGDVTLLWWGYYFGAEQKEHRVVGWSTEPDGAGMYIPNSPTDNKTTDIMFRYASYAENYQLKLYAVWDCDTPENREYSYNDQEDIQDNTSNDSSDQTSDEEPNTPSDQVPDEEPNTPSDQIPDEEQNTPSDPISDEESNAPSDQISEEDANKKERLITTKRIWVKGTITYQEAVQIEWKKVDTCKELQICRATNKKKYKVIQTIKDLNKTKYIDTAVQKGKKYFYKIRYVYANETDKTYSNISQCSLSNKMIKPQITYQNKKGKLYISFRKAEGIRYESQWRGGSVKKWIKIKTTQGAIHKTICKKIKAKTSFQIRIRTLMKVGNKYLKSPWSAAYTVKIS